MSTPSKTLNLLKNVKVLSPVVSPKFGESQISEFNRPNANIKKKSLNLQVPVALNLQIPNDFSKRRENSLLLNTPEKKIVLEQGLEGKTNLKILGQGSFGKVVRGKYNGVDVAIKIIKLVKENKKTNRDENGLYLINENVVRTLDVLFKSNQNYGIVVMEYISICEPLHAILLNKYKTLTISKVKSFAIDICNGLKYCHENKILHLDLKPKNILVCWENICKICDFGNSVKIGENISSNLFHGTIAYTAPELFLGKIPTTASDVYSFSIVLWQMVQKEIPFSDLSCPEIIIYKVVKFGMRPKLSNQNENKYVDLIKQCWSSNAEDRPHLDNIIERLKET